MLFFNNNFLSYLDKRDLINILAYDLIADRGDLNNYLPFVFNNTAITNNKTNAFVRRKYDQNEVSIFYSIIIKFSFKYAAFQHETNMSRAI